MIVAIIARTKPKSEEKEEESMRKRMRMGMLLLAGAAGMGLVAGPAFAEEAEKPTADATVGLYSKYVWRGFELSRDSLVIQPSLTVGYKGFSANFWSNVDTDLDPALKPASSDASFNMNETDITLAYDWAMGPVGFSAGYIYYDLDGLDDSQEVFLSAGLDTILSPTLTVYREIAHTPGWYITAGVSHSIPLKGDLALNLGAQVSYWTFSDADDFGNPNAPNEDSDWHDGLLSASITFPVNEYVSVTPELSYSFALGSNASDRIKAASVDGLTGGRGDDRFLYGGVSVSFSF
jgi:hypothetical protein